MLQMTIQVVYNPEPLPTVLTLKGLSRKVHPGVMRFKCSFQVNFITDWTLDFDVHIYDKFTVDNQPKIPEIEESLLIFRKRAATLLVSRVLISVITNKAILR